MNAYRTCDLGLRYYYNFLCCFSAFLLPRNQLGHVVSAVIKVFRLLETMLLSQVLA